jgi:hypothetical protein
MDSPNIGSWKAHARATSARTHSQGGSRRILKLLCAAAILMGSLAVSAAPAGAAVWRPFTADSPWNVPAAQKGGISSSNPYASQFTSYASSLELSGVAPDTQWGKPIFFAQPGDPAYAWTDQNGWAKGDIRYQGEPIPMPAGAKQATGSDGHLTIVTADRRYAYDMWRANVSSRSAATIVRFDLAGSGVPGVLTSNTSARGSGTPLIPTTIRAEEAVGGIDHALGLTVPHVASSYIWPATHSDGSSGSIKYGMLFVLRPDYPVPAAASLGERNIIAALKTYGAYIVDQGASMGLDADPTHADLWQQAGMLGDASMPVHSDDWRVVNVGTAPSSTPPPPPPPPPAPTPTDPGSGSGSGKKCTKRRERKGKCQPVHATVADAHVADTGQPAVVQGTVTRPVAGKKKRRAKVQVKRHGHWRTIGTAEVRADGTFKLHLPRRKGNRKRHVRVIVPGVGKSKTMTVRL